MVDWVAGMEELSEDPMVTPATPVAAAADPANKEDAGAVVAFSAGSLSSALISSGAAPKPNIFFTVENKLWS